MCMSETELGSKFRLHLTKVAVVSTKEPDLDYSLPVLWGHGHYEAKCCRISQGTVMGAGAGPQILPALVSALQRTVLVTLSPNCEGEVIPAPKDLPSKRNKGGNRGLRKGF